MRLATSRSIVMYLAVLSACGHAPAAITPAAPGAPPAELRVPGIHEHRSSPRFLADRIYVIGRSETRIAYVNEPTDDACGCYTPEIVVLDLKSGKVVWKDSYDSGELDPANPSQWKNLDQLWRARGADWERHLREHGITREPAVTIQPIATGGTTVPRVEIHTEKVGADSPEGYAHLTFYRIDLVSPVNTTQIATSTRGSEFELLDVSVAGYVPARDLGHAAVLVREERRGAEGTPTLSRLRFVGADVHAGPR